MLSATQDAALSALAEFGEAAKHAHESKSTTESLASIARGLDLAPYERALGALAEFANGGWIQSMVLSAVDRALAENEAGSEWRQHLQWDRDNFQAGGRHQIGIPAGSHWNSHEVSPEIVGRVLTVPRPCRIENAEQRERSPQYPGRIGHRNALSVHPAKIDVLTRISRKLRK
jgi:hypothetical protein